MEFNSGWGWWGKLSGSTYFEEWFSTFWSQNPSTIFKNTESLKEFGVCGLYILLLTVLEEIFRAFNIF